MAVGIQHTIEEANYGMLPTATRWALCGGVEVYIVALAIIGLTAAHSSVTWFPCLGSAVAIPLRLAVAGGGLTLLTLEGFLLTVLVAKVGWEIWQVREAGG